MSIWQRTVTYSSTLPMGELQDHLLSHPLRQRGFFMRVQYKCDVKANPMRLYAYTRFWGREYENHRAPAELLLNLETRTGGGTRLVLTSRFTTQAKLILGFLAVSVPLILFVAIMAQQYFVLLHAAFFLLILYLFHRHTHHQLPAAFFRMYGSNLKLTPIQPHA